MHIKKVLLTFFLLFFSYQFSLADETIRGENNAYRHNNKGLIYYREKYYFGAIKEFQIAIDLNPKTQAAAVYYLNLGNTYETIGYHDLAKNCFEKALSLNALCFEYYFRLATNYKNLGIVDEKLEEYIAKTNSPLNQIMVGLLYIQKGETSIGITVLDEFCNNEPNLMVTAGVRKYIQEITLKS